MHKLQQNHKIPRVFIFKNHKISISVVVVNHKIPISAVVVNHKIPNCDEKYIMAGSSQGFVNEETYFNRTGRINSANGFCY